MVDAGRIVERGSPEELVAADGYFRKLYETQRGGVDIQRFGFLAVRPPVVVRLGRATAGLAAKWPFAVSHRGMMRLLPAYSSPETWKRSLELAGRVQLHVIRHCLFFVIASTHVTKNESDVGSTMHTVPPGFRTREISFMTTAGCR